MTRVLSSILAVFATVFLIAGTPAPAVAADAGQALTLNSSAELNGRVLRLALNKSMVLDIPDEIRDVLVSNPKIADAVVRSNRKIYLIGMEVGEANIFLFGDGGRQIAQFELIVSRDTVGLEATFAEVIPGAAIQARTIGDSMVLSGTAPTAEAASRAAEIAARFMGSAEKVVNSIAVSGSDQVNLRVVIAEMQRNVVKQLGINFSSNGSIGGVSFNPITTNPFSSTTDALLQITKSNFSATIRALQQDGVLRTLAEPNLTAVSGEDANFLVGGEFPVVSGQDDNGRIIYEFKPYGVGLSFTPVVLSGGRISLRIKTEISDIDTSNSLAVGNGATAVTIQGFKTRRAETTVELPSGGSIAIGGLVKDELRNSVSGIPGLKELPILGALFKSRQYQRQQTELVIFVTPYTVDAVPTSAITRPDQNFGLVTDAQSLFLSQINRIYRPNGAPAAGGQYHGRVGLAYERAPCLGVES